MKKIIFIVLLCSLATVLFAGDVKTIIVKNNTGYSLNYIYFSPSDFDDWGDDFLEGRVLYDGEEFEVYLDRDIDENQFIYDLQAVDEDDDYYTMYETDISANNTVIVTMDAYDGGDYDDYDDYDYSGYEDGYDDGYSEGYKQGYTEAFRDAYLEGFKAGRETEMIDSGSTSGLYDGGWQ